MSQWAPESCRKQGRGAIVPRATWDFTMPKVFSVSATGTLYSTPGHCGTIAEQIKHDHGHPSKSRRRRACCCGPAGLIERVGVQSGRRGPIWLSAARFGRPLQKSSSHAEQMLLLDFLYLGLAVCRRWCFLSSVFVGIHVSFIRVS